MTAVSVIAAALSDSSKPSPRIAAIEAMRGLAAVSVALFHYSVVLEGAGHDGFAYGWLGVDVFFVISGFVIPLSLHGRGYSVRQFPQFMARRLVRLEPPYLASIALVLAVWHLTTQIPGYAGPPPDYAWPQLVSHFLYAIPLTPYPWLSTVYWSLAYEFVFYILTGLTFAWLIVRPVEWTVLLAALIGVALFRWSGAFDVCVVEFLAGILAMRVVVERGVRPMLWLGVCVMIAAIFASAWVGAAIAAAAASILLLRDRKLGRWALVAGSLSYSLYLTHTSIGMTVVSAARHLGSGLAFELLLMALALAISIAFAALFSWAVERPAIRASRLVPMEPPKPQPV